MDKRILLACIAALAVLLGFELSVSLSGRALDLPLRTPLGELPVAGLGVMFLAMALGGWIARRGFRLPALLLSAVLAVATAASLQLSGALSGTLPAFGVTDILAHAGLAMVASLVLAWLGAGLGQRLAARNAAKAA